MSKLKNKENEIEEGDDDEEDEDYVPENLNESISNDEEDCVDEEKEVKAKKRKSKQNTRGDESSESDIDDAENQNGSLLKKSSNDVTLEFDKKKADDLWSSFLNDVKPKSSVNSSSDPNKYKSAKNLSNETPNDKVIEKLESGTNLNKNNSEVKSFFNQPLQLKVEKGNVSPVLTKKEEPLVKKPKLSGLAGILDKIKEPKINTLEKSRLDWEEFKKSEKIEDDLNTLSKGKGSYLDRQAFLERADMRQFEIEKELRNKERKTRELNK